MLMLTSLIALITKLTATMKILMMRTFDDCGVHRAQGTIDLYALEFENQNEMVMIIFLKCGSDDESLKTYAPQRGEAVPVQTLLTPLLSGGKRLTETSFASSTFIRL